MNILVTGGAGYIGSHTCKALYDRGYTPITYDNLSTGSRDNVRWGPLIVGDINDQEHLRETLQRYHPKGALHFAASALVFESIGSPHKYYENNVAGSISLLEALRKEDVKYLVFSSTCATYGNPHFLPIDENHPQNPISPYGKSKRMVEQIIQDYPLSSVILRYFNAAGADTSGTIGEVHAPETHLIPSILEVALGKRKEISIFGTDFPTPDGSAVRDYIHVEDLAEVHLKALEWLFINQKSTCVNIGTGIGISIFEILKEIERVTGKTIPKRLLSKRNGEPASLIAQNTKACQLFGWEPKKSSLSNLIETAWNWHRQCI